MDTVLLSCTHYPFIRAEIEKGFGESVTVLDPAEATALQARIFLERAGLFKNAGHGTQQGLLYGRVKPRQSHCRAHAYMDRCCFKKNCTKGALNLSFKSGVILILLSAAPGGWAAYAAVFVPVSQRYAPCLLRCGRCWQGSFFLGYLLLRGEIFSAFLRISTILKTSLLSAFWGFWVRSSVFTTPFRCATRQRQRCCNTLRRCLLCCG